MKPRIVCLWGNMWKFALAVVFSVAVNIGLNSAFTFTMLEAILIAMPLGLIVGIFAGMRWPFISIEIES